MTIGLRIPTACSPHVPDLGRAETRPAERPTFRQGPGVRGALSETAFKSVGVPEVLAGPLLRRITGSAASDALARVGLVPTMTGPR